MVDTHGRLGCVIAISSILLAALSVETASAQSSRDPYAPLRNRMVEEFVAQEGVTNQRVLEAMRAVPRHEFVLPKTRKQAYLDMALPIGFKQTISPPFVVAYMTEMIDPERGEKVLEIGTGSGYQAAVLSKLAGEVYSIEIVEPLGRAAARRLRKLGYENVEVKVGDGYKGWKEHAPFDKIIVTCSPENVPQPLVEQLREGGKMIVPLGERYQQVFYLFEKTEGKLAKTKLMPTLFVPMTGISEEKRKVKPDPLNPEIVNGGFEKADDGQPAGFHYRRQTTIVSQGAPEGEQYLLFENDEMGRSAHVLQGLALNGRAIRRVKVEFQVKLADLQAASREYAQPAFVLHFYDAVRKPLGEAVIGPIVVESDWRTLSKTLRVPAKTKEAIVRIGLNGSVGRMGVDGLKLTPVRK